MPMKSVLSLLSALVLCTAAVAADEASGAAPESAAAAAAPESAAAPTPAAAPAAAAQTGTIVFFRPKKFVGGAVGFIVREGTTELGKLRNGRYFSIQAAPGKHEYVVHSETKDVLTLDVDPGETYYVQGTLGVGIVAGRPNLSPSDATTFESLKAGLKPANPLNKDQAEDDKK